ncbi:cytochrome P450 [Blakeslea trispora]|nr:cytochrome P450 [Blakeslea trispora]
MSIGTISRPFNQTIQAILPFLKRQTKFSFIVLSILCLLAAKVYRYFAVPKHLKQFPKFGVFSMLCSFMSLESVYERNQKYIMPFLQQGHPLYIMKLPFEWSMIVISPDLAKVILMKTDAFPKSHEFLDRLGKNNIFVKFLGTKNIAITNGDVWKKQRRLMNPVFHRAMPIQTFGKVMPRLFERIDEKPLKSPMAMLVKRFTLDVLGLAIFAYDFNALLGDPEGWTETYEMIMNYLFDPWMSVLSTFEPVLQMMPSRRKSAQAVDKLNNMILALAKDRRKEISQGKIVHTPDQEKDLLTLLIEVGMEEGIDMTDGELRENLCAFFLAGHDTTGNALTCCLYNLAKNEHVQDKLRKEIISVMGDTDEDRVPTMEDLKQMPYLNRVIKENLRHCGPTDRVLDRVANEDIVVQGITIPKGTTLNIDVISIHMNPRYWRNPEKFIPERFEKHACPPTMAYMPFGQGPHQCIGMNFSLIEQKVFLTMLIKRYSVKIPKDSIHAEKIMFDNPSNFAPADLDMNFHLR